MTPLSFIGVTPLSFIRHRLRAPLSVNLVIQFTAFFAEVNRVGRSRGAFLALPDNAGPEMANFLLGA